MPLRVVLFGTPAFAVPSLERLLSSRHPVLAAVTQPDRPKGRGHKVTPSPVKSAAIGHGIPVLQPERLLDPAFLEPLRAMQLDLGVVAAYGRILPQELLDLPRLGMINVHASLLPRWRGAAPVHRAILAGDRSTGVSIMRVVKALDAGPVLARIEIDIGEDDTSPDLEARLALLGADLLVNVIDRLAAGSVAEEPQDDRLVTYAPRLERSEGQIDWSRPAREVHDRIRGLQPWPLVAARLSGRRVLLRRSALGAASEDLRQPPGTILAVESDALRIATGAGTVRLLEIQPEGRPPMSVRAFVSGHPVRAGDRFEPIDHP
jgi:methionyl-tRNA formyltransferase